MIATSTHHDVRVPITKAYDYVSSPCIRVDVGTGPAMKQFTVYESLITSNSAFFANALGHDWKEARERVVPLPENEPEVFRLYLTYLYASIIPIIPASSKGEGVEEREDGEGDVEKGAQDQYIALSKLYVLAEQLVDETTKSTVLDALAAHAKETNFRVLPDGESIYVIYSSTVDSNEARNWLIDLYTDYGGARSLGSNDSAYPADFIADVARSVLTKRTKPGVHEATQDQLTKTEAKLKKMTSELAEAKKALSAKEKANQKLQEKYDNCVEDLQDAESEVKELQAQIKRKIVVRS
ncbi:hypothetical protein B5807_08442 [Epicoccum nigrum]|uniref:BTB domain-containing protein n=1 Tax=Epicoccum nigrum TaxID=105696 RepID=A0A1Y2LU87_EPING|nr:hypothetical protein B5807_08442 [Epicoccum nigrum]